MCGKLALLCELAVMVLEVVGKGHIVLWLIDKIPMLKSFDHQVGNVYNLCAASLV